MTSNKSSNVITSNTATVIPGFTTSSGDVSNSPVKIIIGARGWVWVGRFHKEGRWNILDNAHCIRVWGTERGLGQLVNGPLEKTILDPVGQIHIHELSIVGRYACNTEAWTAGRTGTPDEDKKNDYEKEGSWLSSDRVVETLKNKADDIGNDIKILIGARGWVWVGKMSKSGRWIVLDNAQCIRIWGTDKGLGQLVVGPTEKTVLDDVGQVEVHELSVVGIYRTNSNLWRAKLLAQK